LGVTALLTGFVMLYPVWAIRRTGGRVFGGRPGFFEFLLEGIIACGAFLGIMGVNVAIALTWRHVSDESPGIPKQLEELAFSGDVAAFILLAVMACVWAPISEELFFRRFLQRALAWWMPVAAAVILQAAIFAVMHDYSGPHLAAILVLGLSLGGLYAWRRRLLTPMLLHCLQNTFATTMMGLLMFFSLRAPVLGVVCEDTLDGCRVTAVERGSAAEEVGVRVGDVITSIDGAPVETFLELRVWLMTKSPTQVNLYVRRDGEPVTLQPVLKPRGPTGLAAEPDASHGNAGKAEP
jgi:membrane protease YdiL (CAAX protease family)